MNDKDKEAFEGWLYSTDMFASSNSSIQKYLLAWQAACEYRDREQYIEGSIHESGGIKREMTWKESSDMFEKMYMNTISRLDKEYERIRSIKAENKKLREALEFYANCTRLMLDVKDLPIDPIIGEPMFSSKSIMDNGDRAREALKEVEK